MCTAHVLLMQSCKRRTSALFSLEKVIDTLIVLKMLASYSALVHLVRARSMYVGIFFGLGTLVRLVQPRSHVCWYFIWS